MKVMCAWCRNEGKPAFLREIVPLDDPTETHGICSAHRLELLAELASDRVPPAGTGRRDGRGPAGSAATVLCQRIDQLRKEVRALRVENDALRAARRQARVIFTRFMSDAARDAPREATHLLEKLQALMTPCLREQR